MILQLKRNRNGSYRSRVFDVSFILDSRDTPEEGPYIIESDVMIVRALMNRLENGCLDYSVPPYAYLVRRVTEDDVLVEHSGFECSGSMCTTLSSASVYGRRVTLSPGRLHGGGLYVADNVGANFYKSPSMPLIPGQAFVSSHSLSKPLDVIRIEGIPDFSNTFEYVAENNLTFQDWKVRNAAWENTKKSVPTLVPTL